MAWPSGPATVVNVPHSCTVSPLREVCAAADWATTLTFTAAHAMTTNPLAGCVNTVASLADGVCVCQWDVRGEANGLNALTPTGCPLATAGGSTDRHRHVELVRFPAGPLERVAHAQLVGAIGHVSDRAGVAEVTDDVLAVASRRGGHDTHGELAAGMFEARPQPVTRRRRVELADEANRGADVGGVDGRLHGHAGRRFLKLELLELRAFLEEVAAGGDTHHRGKGQENAQRQRASSTMARTAAAPTSNRFQCHGADPPSPLRVQNSTTPHAP